MPQAPFAHACDLGTAATSLLPWGRVRAPALHLSVGTWKTLNSHAKGLEAKALRLVSSFLSTSHAFLAALARRRAPARGRESSVGLSPGSTTGSTLTSMFTWTKAMPELGSVALRPAEARLVDPSCSCLGGVSAARCRPTPPHLGSGSTSKWPLGKPRSEMPRRAWPMSFKVTVRIGRRLWLRPFAPTRATKAQQHRAFVLKLHRPLGALQVHPRV